MVYLAHTENERGISHALKDHLTSVGELAAEFAAEMNPALCESARWAGLKQKLSLMLLKFSVSSAVPNN